MRKYGTELLEANYPISFHSSRMVPFCWFRLLPIRASRQKALDSNTHSRHNYTGRIYSLQGEHLPRSCDGPHLSQHITIKIASIFCSQRIQPLLFCYGLWNRNYYIFWTITWFSDLSSFAAFATCASALFRDTMAQIRNLCFFPLKETQLEPAIHFLSNGKILLTNISQLNRFLDGYLKCIRVVPCNCKVEMFLDNSTLPSRYWLTKLANCRPSVNISRIHHIVMSVYSPFSPIRPLETWEAVLTWINLSTCSTTGFPSFSAQIPPIYFKRYET